MARTAQFGRRDFTGDPVDDLVGASTILELFIGGVTPDREFTDARGENHSPRFFTCEVTGILNVIDWADNAVALNLIQGQVRSFRPKTVVSSGSTATVTLEW